MNSSAKSSAFKGNLLVVDDDSLIHDSLSLILPQSWRMISVKNSSGLPSEGHFHAAFVDMHLTKDVSRAEGPEVIRKIRAQFPLTEIYAMSGTMEKMTVNLAGEPKRMIRVEVNVELLNPVGFAEIMEGDRRAKVRDSIMTLLGEQSFSDIESIQGKLFLKDKITADLNSRLDQGIVKAVYFSEFVVQ